MEQDSGGDEAVDTSSAAREEEDEDEDEDEDPDPVSALCYIYIYISWGFLSRGMLCLSICGALVC